MKNRAAYMTELNKMEIREVPVPEPKEGEVLIRVEYVGICGSDVHYFHDGRCGDFVVDGEFMLGHEAGGVVEKLGPGVTTLAVGDKSLALPAGSANSANPANTTFALTYSSLRHLLYRAVMKIILRSRQICALSCRKK